jgi:hypothetical protein
LIGGTIAVHHWFQAGAVVAVRLSGVSGSDINKTKIIVNTGIVVALPELECNRDCASTCAR